MQKRAKYLGVFILGIVFLCSVAFSQSKGTGAIEGTIIDSEGDALPGVEILLSSPNMIGGDQIRITDGNGEFRFVGLLPGIYKIEASLQGFVTSRREMMRLHMGQTLTVTIELRIATVEEEIIVTGRAPIIDIKDSAIGTSTLDKDFLENVPNAGRRTSSMANQAPGVWSSMGFGGRSRTGNSYTIDGVETRYPRTGEDWSMVDFNVFQEMQILGLGASAEHDGFSGIVQNSITKSGGNSFHGHIEFLYSDWNWTAENFDPNEEIFSLYDAGPKRQEIIGAFSIGGPILKDRLWFFVAHKRSSNKREIEGMGEKSNLMQPTYFAKLTWQPTINDRIAVFFDADFYINPRYGLSIYKPPETTYNNRGPTYMINLNGLHTFSDTTFLEYKLLRYWAPQVLKPWEGYDLSGRYDDSTGIYSVNSDIYYDSQADRNQGIVTLSHHAKDFIKGSHDFKFGADVEATPAFDELGYTNGMFYKDNVYSFYDYSYHTYGYSYMYNTDVTGTKFSVFAQDAWEISDDLVINPGIRYNIYRGSVKSLGKTVFKTQTFLPRLGFTWDIFGDHSTALKAHYGRYSDGIKNNYFQRADPGQEDFVIYDVMSDGSLVEVYRLVLSNPSDINQNMKHPTMDQFTLGIERELIQDTAIAVSFILRKWRNLAARVNTGGAWEKIPWTFTDDKGVEQTIDIFKKTTPSSADAFLITNAGAGEYSAILDQKSTYFGLLFTLTKRFSHNWMLVASYTYSRLTGTEQGGSTGSEQSKPPWIDPNLQINIEGHLAGDFTHQVKIYSTFIMPFDIFVSPSFQYVTGAPWVRRIKAPVSGSPVINVEAPNSSQRIDPLINFDLRLEKSFSFGTNKRVGFQIDVFNLFNRGYATRIETRLDRSSFGLAQRVNQGRHLRLGVRFLF